MRPTLSLDVRPNRRRIPFATLALSIAAGVLAPSGASADEFGSGTNAFTMDFVSIGDAGNAPDLSDGRPQGSGAVAYQYRMGTYEVSRTMVDRANALGGLNIQVVGAGVNRPAAAINWNEAARFVNWLNENAGFRHAYKFRYQPSDTANYSANANILLWGPGDPGYDSNNPYRNTNAAYFLPNVNEWFKSAYYKGGGLNSGYWVYPTQSDSPPVAVVSGTSAGTAVYDSSFGAVNVDRSGGLSWYGTMGQGGNVYEWNEDAIDGVNDDPALQRVLRGGSFGNRDDALRYSSYGSVSPQDGFGDMGFRVASIAAVPEPSTYAMALAGLACGGWQMVRRRWAKASLTQPDAAAQSPATPAWR
jgi:formylglycine-generating enzyme required for sulfatase activity